jgi:hypothetical protein
MRIMTLLLVLGATSFMTGCKWVDRARAEHHEERAKEEAKSLNFGAAIDEHEKAVEARKAVKSDPLP